MIHKKTYANGLTLIADSTPWLYTSAFTFLVPVGYVHDPENRLGLGSVLSEMLLRGSEKQDSREFLMALDRLSLIRSGNVYSDSLEMGAAVPEENLYAALELHADALLRPRLDNKQELDAVRQSILQELASEEDDPSERLEHVFLEQMFAYPWGRSENGTPQGVRSVTLQDVHRHYSRYVRPNGALLVVTGPVNWRELSHEVELLFSAWEPREIPPVKTSFAPRRSVHVPFSSRQTYMMLGWNSVPESHPDAVFSSVINSALGCDSASRLFNEIREKRGLCYSVSTSRVCVRDSAIMLVSLETSPGLMRQAQIVLLAELERLKEGLTQDELDRWMASMRTDVILQNEWAPSRCSQLVYDSRYKRKLRTNSEILRRVESITLSRVNAYLREHLPSDILICTLGKTC